ncbi:MAG: ABC transporter ATP-binding protein [Gemmatimonadota bacterium]|nr:ABC transporter ATP-binding protein [Gemmatimonadota bacterium]
MITPPEPRYAPVDPAIARRLAGFLVPYRTRILAAVGLLVVLAGIEVAQPWLIKIAIDRHVATGDLTGLAGIAAIYLTLLLVEAVVGAARTWITTEVGQRAMHDIRERLFDKLQRLPVGWFDRTPVGRMVTRVTSDVEVLNELFSSGVVALISDVFMLTAIAVTMFVLDWRLALVTLAVVPLVALVSFVFRARMRDAYREIRRRVAQLNAYLQERVTGLEVVQLFRREEESKAAFAEVNRSVRDAEQRSIFYYAVFYPLVELLGALSVALLIWYGGGRILAGALTFGSLVAFLQYAQKFFRPIRDMAEKYNLLQSATAAGERLLGLLDEPVPDSGVAVADRLPEPRGAIAFEDVWFRYEPDAWVLKGVSFEVPAGSKLALVGATGAGKSTIASLLCRFYEPTEGRVLLDGVDVRAYPLPELRERVGLVLQDVFLFSGSVRENVALGSERIDEAGIEGALAAIGADRFVDALPSGLDTRVGERGRSLSTGQKQLVAFARALAWDPPVLVFDEATSSVDSESEALIEEAVRRLMADRTSVVIAHRLSTIRRVDRILVLHHGEVREEGTHEELLAAGGIYARLYQLQYASEAGATAGAAP